MKNNLHELIFSSLVGRIGGVFVSVYALFWTLAEPMSLPWIDNHRAYWRAGLIIASILVTIILLIPLASRYLEQIKVGGSDTNLLDTCVSTGNPTLTEMADGKIGTVAKVSGDYTADPMDWQLSKSAQKAGTLEFVFKYNKVPFHFYVRVAVVSNDGSATSIKWIRFDHDAVIPDQYNRQEEMKCPYNTVKLGSYQKATIDINKAVKDTFGQGGWTYQRVMIFRVRGEGFIKFIGFKR